MIAITRPLPQPTLDRLLAAVAEGYNLSPTETAHVAKVLERANVPLAVQYDAMPHTPSA